MEGAKAKANAKAKAKAKAKPKAKTVPAAKQPAEKDAETQAEPTPKDLLFKIPGWSEKQPVVQEYELLRSFVEATEKTSTGKLAQSVKDGEAKLEEYRASVAKGPGADSSFANLIFALRRRKRKAKTVEADLQKLAAAKARLDELLGL